MLGIGTPELMVIGLVIVVFYGPDRLPQLLAKVSRTLSDIRMMGHGVRQQFQREMLKVESEIKHIDVDINAQPQDNQASLQENIDPADPPIQDPGSSWRSQGRWVSGSILENLDRDF